MFRLTDRRHMSDLVPYIVTQEKADIKAEILGKPVSVIFDGTTRLGEAMALYDMLTIPSLFSST